ncbi:unnamed protein product [Blepharisma stoltei]|uniref:Myb-like DNA-binding domain containing protein n=1 Tax=Blepharisma stoltei TaxID=1481888 RepID=A0AAU9KFG3_9CILI|nr:unnamed protein product [Blepharisma stoltei]
MSWSGAINVAGGYWRTPEAPRSCWDTCCAEEPVRIIREPQHESIHEKEKHGKAIWTKDDDKRLSKYAIKMNFDWEKIARKFPHKTSVQVQSRWRNKLNPSIKKSPWTEAEDVLLKNIVLDIGMNWYEVSKYIEGRTPNSAKNRFHSIIVGTLSPEEALIIEQKSKTMGGIVGQPDDDPNMDIDSEEKESQLKELYSKEQELQDEMSITVQQIQFLERTLYKTNG